MTGLCLIETTAARAGYLVTASVRRLLHSSDRSRPPFPVLTSRRIVDWGTEDAEGQESHTFAVDRPRRHLL